MLGKMLVQSCVYLSAAVLIDSYHLRFMLQLRKAYARAVAVSHWLLAPVYALLRCLHPVLKATRRAASRSGRRVQEWVLRLHRLSIRAATGRLGFFGSTQNATKNTTYSGANMGSVPHATLVQPLEVDMTSYVPKDHTHDFRNTDSMYSSRGGAGTPDSRRASPFWAGISGLLFESLTYGANDTHIGQTGGIQEGNTSTVGDIDAFGYSRTNGGNVRRRSLSEVSLTSLMTSDGSHRTDSCNSREDHLTNAELGTDADTHADDASDSDSGCDDDTDTEMDSSGDEDLIHTRSLCVEYHPFYNNNNSTSSKSGKGHAPTKQKPQVALRNLNLRVRRGQKVAILGSNGGGKSECSGKRTFRKETSYQPDQSGGMLMLSICYSHRCAFCCMCSHEHQH